MVSLVWSRSQFRVERKRCGTMQRTLYIALTNHKGFLGAIKGSARSCELCYYASLHTRVLTIPSVVNAGARPAAGIAGLISHPLQGASASLAKHFSKPPIQVCRSTRISDGIQDVGNASKEEKNEVLRAWKEATQVEREKARKEEYKKRAKEMLLEAKEEVKDADKEFEQDGESSSNVGVMGTESVEDEERWAKELDMALQLSLQTPSSGSQGCLNADESRTGEDEQFLKDMERARQMSLEGSH